MWASFTGALKGALSPRRTKYESSGGIADASASPLTVLVHVVFYEGDESRDRAAALADMLSREFGYGADAVEADALPDSIWGRSVMCSPSRPVTTRSEFDGLAEASSPSTANDMDDDPRNFERSLTADRAACHRRAVALAASATVLHQVVVSHKRNVSTLVPAIRGCNVPIPFETPRSVTARTGLIVMIFSGGHPSQAPRSASSYSPAGSDDDANDGDIARDTLTLTAADLASAPAFAAAHDAARNKLMVLHESRRGDSTAVSLNFTSEATTTNGDVELSTGFRQMSCMSWTDLNRLPVEQLSLLQIIATNLNRASENEMYRTLNAGSDRFYDTLGRFPAVLRTLRNLGFRQAAPKTTPSLFGSDRTLIFTEGPEYDPRLFAGVITVDRQRTLTALGHLLAAKRDAGSR